MALAFAAASLSPSAVLAEGPIKIGFPMPLSGPTAVYGVPILKGAEMAVEEINAKGGVCITKGDKKTCRKIAPVVVDPASNWDLFAEKAKQLLLQDKVGRSGQFEEPRLPAAHRDHAEDALALRPGRLGTNEVDIEGRRAVHRNRLSRVRRKHESPKPSAG